MNPAAPILLVEDDDDVADAVSELLAAAGFEVGHAPNGQAGLDYLRTHRPPRMILLDWYMPLMDGRQMMSALQAEPRWRAIPVVLLTADPEARNRALEVRAAGYLKKPFDGFDLLTIVDNTLRYPS
jgi:CheY-like chemotaxis protein